MANIERFYDNNAQREWNRLDGHTTEFAVTMRALREYLPPPPARIADIGGGPGRYSIALGRLGYTVTLADLSAGLLAFARGKASEAGVTLEDYVHINALELEKMTGAPYDAVLLMGPLYHLLTLEDRLRAVRGARGLLKPGGLVFASFIARYAGIRWAAKNLPSWLVDKRNDAERLLETGVNIPPDEGGFTDSYFAQPSEIRPLMEEGGFQTLDLIGCEGLVSMIEEKLIPLEGELWEAWVDINYRLGRDPSIHGAVEHLLYVGVNSEHE